MGRHGAGGAEEAGKLLITSGSGVQFGVEGGTIEEGETIFFLFYLYFSKIIRFMRNLIWILN